MVKYLEDSFVIEDVKEELLEWQRLGLQETASGYGKKLTSGFKVKVNGRWYRVYVTCISNVSSLWITVQGTKYVIRESIALMGYFNN